MFVCSLCCCNPLYLYYILGRTEGIGKKKSGSIHIPFGSRNSPLFCGKNAALYILQNKKSFSKTFFSPLPVREKFSESLRQLVDGDYLRILRFNDIDFILSFPLEMSTFSTLFVSLSQFFLISLLRLTEKYFLSVSVVFSDLIAVDMSGNNLS